MAGKQADIKVGVITNYDDKGIRSAETGLKGFANSIKSADGFTGKLKAGVGSLGASLKTFVSGPGGMLAAGGAIAAAGEFAIQAVSKFSDLGVEIGKLSDATGLTNEAASRWKEVAGDIGIESGTLESSIGKLNKTLGTSPKLFKDAGIEISRTKDGAIDVNETFLNTVDALNGMKNPADKAALATKLLGKGWQGMAELIEQGSGKLSKSMADVSDIKVFDDDKIQKARQFREATDNLKDVMEDFTLEVGEHATPAIVGLATALGMLPEVVGAVLGPVGDLIEAVGNLSDEASKYLGIELDLGLDGVADSGVRATESFASLETKAKRLSTGTDVLARAQDGLAVSVDNTTRKTDIFAESIAGVDQAYSGLTGKLDEGDAWEKVILAIGQAGDAAKLTGQDARDLTRDIADYVAHTNTIPVSKKTEILALLDEGKIAEAEAALAALTRTRDIYLKLTGPGAVTAAGPGGLSGARAHGGPVSPGGAYLVGEKGPEVLQMGSQGGNIIPNGGGGQGGPISVTINMPPGSNGNDVVRAIEQWRKRNGNAKWMAS